MLCHARSFALTLVVYAGAAQAAIINVPADQPTIQDAIAAAVNGDEIVVAPGTYTEQLNFLGKAITVRSSVGAATTIISGGGSIAPLVTFATGESASSRLVGFTLRDANSATASGGAIQINAAGPTIVDCIVSNNTLTGGNTGAGAAVVDGSPTFLRTTFRDNTSDGFGGNALDIVGLSNVIITDSTFINNEDASAAGNPGAVGVSTSTLTVTNSTFTGNDLTGGGIGGGIYADNSTVTVTGGIFENNTSLDGGSGGGIYIGSGDLTVTNVIFRANQAGGIYASNSNTIITDSTFEDNINAGSTGGGVSIESGTATITGSTFTRNQTPGGSGGGVGVSTSTDVTILNISDSTFTENQSPGGSGAAFAAEGPIFANVAPVSGVIDRCTFINNGLLDDPNNGGSSSTVILRRRTNFTFTSSLFNGNTGASGCVSLESNGRGEFINCTLIDNVPDPFNRTFQMSGTAVLRVRNSIVRGSLANSRRMFPASLPVIALVVENSNVSGGYAGTGNINLDPDFVDAPNGNFRLNATSPSLDTGNNAFVPASSLLDLAGASRIAGSAVDMGAYELGGGPVCDDIDFNNNGVFPEDQDVLDFFEVLAGGNPLTCDAVAGCNDIDFNNNGVFPEDQDIIDFFTVLAGGNCP